jgi:predicted nucleic acid-binding protein
LTLVLDASIALAWRFEDEKTPVTEALFDRVIATGAVAPVIWALEVANALRVSERRGRVSAEFVDASLRDFLDLSIEIDPETPAQAWTATLALARAHNLTLYDAAYLELALRRDLPLATLDARLRAAAQSLGRPVLGI